MRLTLALVLVSLLLTGCIQSERRYDVRTGGEILVVLVDRENGCAWVLIPGRGFVKQAVEGHAC